MRRTWLAVLSWCVGFVWAVGLILNAVKPPPPEKTPLPPVPVPTATLQARTIHPPPVESPPVVEPSTIEPEVTKPAHTQYVGNTNTHKFHFSECLHAKCPNCTRGFATREEAAAAGFIACKICNP